MAPLTHVELGAEDTDNEAGSAAGNAAVGILRDGGPDTYVGDAAGACAADHGGRRVGAGSGALVAGIMGRRGRMRRPSSEYVERGRNDRTHIIRLLCVACMRGAWRVPRHRVRVPRAARVLHEPRTERCSPDFDTRGCVEVYSI